MGMRVIQAALLALGMMLHCLPAQAAEPDVRDVRDGGMVARYHLPAPGVAAKVPVVMLGGSDGGLPSGKAAASLAKAGHPVLALAYFRAEGLPPMLDSIPLERVRDGIAWLRAQPEAAGRRVALVGESRGAELALLVATRDTAVAGVVAFSPSLVAWAGTDPLRPRPAWTDAGQPVPFLDVARGGELTSVERFEVGLARDQKATVAATIPVERVAGPVLLVASSADKVWPAAAMAERLVAVARQRGARHGVELLAYPDASHLLMGPGPGLVRLTYGSFTIDFGGTEEGTRAARDDAWAHTQAFLARLS